MTKAEFIERYGEEAYQRKLENGKEYRQNHKERLAEYFADYYQNNKDKIAKQKAEYLKNHKDKFAKYQAEYRKNNKPKLIEKKAEYRKNNKDKIAEYNAEYYQNNKEYFAEYRQTPIGRASILLGAYKKADEQRNRGECTITSQWIVDNIFTSKCHYCGESDWHKLGCDRVDNSLPHTPDNVVCCCGECNIKRNRTDYQEFLRRMEK